MSYEPKGKVALIIAAMRAPGAAAVWTSAECAAAMDVVTGSLPAYLEAAIKNGVIHKRIDNGRSYFSLQAFEAQDARPAPTQANLMVPRFGENFVPPKMIAPRGDNQPPRVRLPMPLHQVIAEPPAPAAKPETPESEVDQELEGEGESEPMDFNAALWADGDLMLYGLEELEDGGYKLGAEHVPALKRLLAGVAG